MAAGAPSLCLSQHARTHRLDVTAASGASGDTRCPAENDSLCAGKWHHMQAGESWGREQRGLGRGIIVCLNAK